MIVFIQKESLTSKNSPSLQNSLQPFFIIFATDPWYFWLKAVPPSLEAVLKANKALMSSLRSGIPKLKKLDSLQFNLQVEFDLNWLEMLWTSSKYAKRTLEAAVEAIDENIEDK